MISKELVFHKMNFNYQDDLFDYFSDFLEDRKIVKNGFSEALKTREKNFPTGLPVVGGVAIPHTDGSLVLEDKIIFATLENPVTFNEMGGEDDDVIEVQIVIMLAIAGGKKHLNTLQQLIASIQNSEFIDGMLSANSEAELFSVVENGLCLV